MRAHLQPALRVLCDAGDAPGRDHAIETAADVAVRIGADLVLAHGADADADALGATAARLAVSLGVDVTLHRSADRVVDLAAVARAHACALIVMPRAPGSALAARFTGARHAAVADRAPCPVVVVGGPCAPVLGGTVVLGYAVPRRWSAAAAHAGRLAGRLGVPVAPVHVPARDNRPGTLWQRRTAHVELADAVRRAGGELLEGVVAPPPGRRAAMLARVGEDLHAALIVVGRTPRGWRRLLSPGVAAQLPYRTCRPVMLVGRGVAPVAPARTPGLTSRRTAATFP